jgi:hypothetical protein
VNRGREKYLTSDFFLYECVRGVLGGGVKVGGVVWYEQGCQVKKSKKASLDQKEFKK